MRITTLEEQNILSEFAESAAKRFASNDKLATFTADAVGRGALFAVRWGLDKTAVLVVRISEDMEPVVYSGLVEKEGGAE